MQNASLDEVQAGIKIIRTNINNLRHSEDTILMAEKKRGYKQPLDESKRREQKSWLKPQHSKH